MDIKEIEALVALIEKSDVAELDYTSDDGERVYINKYPPQSPIPQQLEVAPPAQQYIASQPQAAEQPVQTEPATPVDADISITAPLVGTFYTASSPDTPPFVTVGKNVKKGDVICIIEAMKIMNQVRADKEGTVTEILVSNGQPVEYGQALVRLQ